MGNPRLVQELTKKHDSLSEILSTIDQDVQYSLDEFDATYK